MKKIIPFTILIIALLSFNCTSNKNANTDTKILSFPESGEDTLKTSYFADTVIYIPLETTKESLMDYIDQIWIDNSFILINCRKTDLLLFQQDGKFLRKIGKHGRGPGEYGLIFHFDVIHDTIYVSPTGRRGFLRYTFDGTFCDEIKLNYEPIFFSTTVDQKLICYRIEEGEIYVYNKNLYFPPDTIVVENGVTKGRYKYFFSDQNMPYLQKTPSGLLFYDYMSDTVWNITNNQKEPAFIIDMKNKLPRDKNIEFCNGDTKGWSQMVRSFQFVHLIPFPTCILVFQKHWRGNQYDAIYLNNTKTWEIKKFNKTWIYDDMVSQQRLWVLNWVYSADYLVAISYPPGKDPKQNKENIKAAPSPLWLNQMKTVKEDDNPILALIKLKKNLQ